MEQTIKQVDAVLTVHLHNKKSVSPCPADFRAKAHEWVHGQAGARCMLVILQV